MDFETIRHFFSMEHILALLEDYRSYGPIPAVLFTFCEAFLPFLPLFLFVMGNAAAFGLFGGFLISWIGVCAGSLTVFFIVRKIGQKKFFQFVKNHPSVKKLMVWVEKHGFGPLFILLCFPFTPSAAVNIVAALSRVSVSQFILAVLAGKMVMIFMVSFVGYDLKALVEQPLRTVLVLIIMFLLWYGGKRVERRLQVTSLPKK